MDSLTWLQISDLADFSTVHPLTHAVKMYSEMHKREVKDETRQDE